MPDSSAEPCARPREQRRNVVLQARLRSNCRWGDACILNLSPRGLMVYAPQPADPGSFVEIRRGEQAIVARVVWRRNNRIGLRSERLLELDQVITGAGSQSAPGIGAVELLGERRQQPRSHDDSRLRARIAEFASIIVVAAVLAGSAYSLVARSLSAPINRMIAELEQRQG